MNLWPVSVAALLIVTLLCITGTLAPSFKDNLAQRAGMALLAYGCASRVESIWHSQYVPIDALFLHLGMAIYACGTAYKHWRYTTGRVRAEPEPLAPHCWRPPL